MIQTAGHRAWVFLEILALNYLWTGNSAADGFERQRRPGVSKAQARVLSRIEAGVDRFLDEAPAVPGTGWGRFRNLKVLWCDEGHVVKGGPLTWKQMQPGLPKPGVAGRVRAVDLAGPSMRPFLEEPERSEKPRHLGPEQLGRSQVCAAPGVWQGILQGLHGPGMVQFDDETEPIRWNGRPFVYGCFGVPEEGLASPDLDSKTGTPRLIADPPPSNDVLTIIKGDIDRPPLFSQWRTPYQLEREMYAGSGGDRANALSIYRLEDGWLPYFVVDEPATTETLGAPGLPTAQRWAAMRTIPEGWLSATGMMQPLAHRIAGKVRSRAGMADNCAESSRGTTASVGPERRVSDWHDAVLHDDRLAEKGEEQEQESLVGATALFQLQFHEATSERGIPLTERKCIRRATQALARCGILNEGNDPAAPSGDRAARLVGCAWCLFRQKRMQGQHLASVSGQLVFMTQFPRSALLGLNGIREAMEYEVDDVRKMLASSDLPRALSVLPIVVTDFRAPSSPVVMGSDVPLGGAGVGFSHELSERGRRGLFRGLRPLPDVCGRYGVLLESSAGIGDARRGAQSVKMRPRLYSTSSEDAHAGIGVTYGAALASGQQDSCCAGSRTPPCAAIGGCPKRGIIPCAECDQFYCPEHTHFENGSVNKCVFCLAAEEAPRRGEMPESGQARSSWPAGEVIPRAGVVPDETEDVSRVRLAPSRTMPVSQWLDDGEEAPDTFGGHSPTLTQLAPVARPRGRTPGDDTCDDARLAQGANDSHRRPAIRPSSVAGGEGGAEPHDCGGSRPPACGFEDCRKGATTQCEVCDRFFCVDHVRRFRDGGEEHVVCLLCLTNGEPLEVDGPRAILSAGGSARSSGVIEVEADESVLAELRPAQAEPPDQPHEGGLESPAFFLGSPPGPGAGGGRARRGIEPEQDDIEVLMRWFAARQSSRSGEPQRRQGGSRVRREWLEFTDELVAAGLLELAEGLPGDAVSLCGPFRFTAAWRQRRLQFEDGAHALAARLPAPEGTAGSGRQP